MAKRLNTATEPTTDTTAPANVTGWRLVNGGLQVTVQHESGSVSVVWTEILGRRQ